MRDRVARMLAPLVARIALLVARAIVKGRDDSKKLRELRLDVLAGESLEQVEHFQEYGFTSAPHDDAEAILLSLGGDRGHSVVIATGDRRYRIPVVKGEVAMFTDEGDKIHLKRGNEIHIVTDTLRVTCGAVELVLDTTGLTVTGGTVDFNS